MTNAPEVDALVDAARRRPEGRLVAFPTPDAQLVKATLAMAETEQLRAQLEHVRAEWASVAERLDDIHAAALRVKTAKTDLERQLAASLLVEMVLAEESKDCPICDATPCERTCPAGRES